MIYILTMVILTSGGGGVTSFTQEYGTQERCAKAAQVNREALGSGRVILATCTQK